MSDTPRTDEAVIATGVVRGAPVDYVTADFARQLERELKEGVMMKSLDEFNAERREQHGNLEMARKPHPNGIACPDCGKELWDSAPMMTLTSNPPQKNVHCPACNYHGYRVA